jgi:6-pyruvoyltetrahydropterin/6-carboxytetrahydropterin synthase
MYITIAKRFCFEAAHKLPDELIYGKCSNLHGHSYKLIIEISGEIKPDGMIMNFGRLKDIVQRYVLDLHDHSNLNDIYEIPTAEYMVLGIGETLLRHLPGDVNLKSITLYETESCYAKIIY